MSKTNFINNGVFYQEVAETTGQAVSRMNASCVMCRSNVSLCLDCEACRIKHTHDMVMVALTADEERKAAKERQIQRDAVKVKQTCDGMLLLLKLIVQDASIGTVRTVLDGRMA